MNKLFEVPYNFNVSLLPFYKKYASFINYLFVPPYKDDLLNTRSSIETRKKGRCYMPQSRYEYEQHLNKITSLGLRYVVLWQVRDSVIPLEKLKYYAGLSASGFIIGNDDNARVIKDFDPKLLVICSLVQRVCSDVLKRNFDYYDYVILYYPFNRALKALKLLSSIKEKIILMPNTLCHIDCPSIHHWFPSKDRPFELRRDCLALKDDGKYISHCGFISPEHLHYFDGFVGGYKLQGREYATDLIKYICELYFKRESPKELLNAMFGEDLFLKYDKEQQNTTIEDYYNIKSEEIINKINGA